MRWTRWLLPVLLLLVPSCAIFGSSEADLPPVMPPNFFIGLRVLEATSPPVDYQIKIERSGNVKYETTVRAPRRRSAEGTLELSEAQVVRLYQAVLDAGYDDLGALYEASEGAADRRGNGERIFYVVAGDVDKRVDVNYATVPALDALQKAIVAEMPGYVVTGEGGPDAILDRPEAFVGDKGSKAFHHPECELVKDIGEGDRDPYRNEYDALNFGYHPCEVCRPLETRK